MSSSAAREGSPRTRPRCRILLVTSRDSRSAATTEANSEVAPSTVGADRRFNNSATGTQFRSQAARPAHPIPRGWNLAPRAAVRDREKLVFGIRKTFAALQIRRKTDARREGKLAAAAAFLVL